MLYQYPPPRLKPKLFPLTEPNGSMRLALSGIGDFHSVNIVEGGGSVLGWASLTEMLGDTTFSVFVAKSHRGNGLARQLASELLMHSAPTLKGPVVYSPIIAPWLEPELDAVGLAGSRIPDLNLIQLGLVPSAGRQRMSACERQLLASYLRTSPDVDV